MPAEPVFHLLCSACKRLLAAVANHPKQKTRTDRAYRTMKLNTLIAMTASAAGGCHLCSLVCNSLGWNPEDCDFASEELIADVSYSTHGDVLPVISIGRETDSDGALSYLFSCWIRIDPLTDASRSRTLFKRVPISTEENSVDLALNWLKECDENHRDCNERHVKAELSYPTRILQIVSDGKEETIKLCETSKLPEKERERYTTLSYCWGGEIPRRLLQTNYEEYLRGFSIALLPQTFQDAIRFTKKLGVNYIWIDSQCIVQDDKADWDKEALLMTDVYTNGYLNIAANAEHVPSGSLFQQRDPLTVMSCKVNLTWSAAGWREKPVAFLPYGYGSIGDLSSAPLSTRAWCVQERLLSKRTIHFTKQNVVWECTILSASESDITGALEKRNGQGKSPIHGWAVADAPITNMEQAHKSLDKWATAVELYTRANLTKQEDKLIAVAGIAKLVKGIFDTNSALVDYCAGLWNYFGHHWILWKVVGDGKRPADETAPSWSWASVDGPIRMPRSYKINDEGKLEQLTRLSGIKTFPINDPFGRVNGGILELQGPVCPVLLVRDVKDRSKYVLQQFQTIEVILDESQYKTESSAQHFLLGYNIDHSIAHDPLSGLILRKTGKARGEYVRVGTWISRHSADEDEIFPGLRLSDPDHPGWAFRDAQTADYDGVLDELYSMLLESDEYRSIDEKAEVYDITIV